MCCSGTIMQHNPIHPESWFPAFCQSPTSAKRKDACSSEIRNPEKPKPLLCHNFQPATGRSALPFGIPATPHPARSTSNPSLAAHSRFSALHLCAETQLRAGNALL